MRWIIVLLLAGCHLQPRTFGLRGTAPAVTYTREECAVLDRNQLGWSVSAVIFGVLGGGSGGLTAVVPDDTPKYVVGSLSLVFGIFAGVSTLLAPAYAKRYADGCTVNTGGK